jgi:hypothetical protein
VDSTPARSLIPYLNHAKVDDADRFPFLKGGLEEFKSPLQRRGRRCFRDPRFLMNALSDVLLLHLGLFQLRQEALLLEFSPALVFLCLLAGGHPARGLDQNAGPEWFHAIGQTKGGHAANQALQQLHFMYVKADEWELFTGRNPAPRIKKFPKHSRERLSIQRAALVAQIVGRRAAHRRKLFLVFAVD